MGVRLPGRAGAKRAILAFRRGCAGQLLVMTHTFGPHVLRDYALIADGERGALIGPDGAIAWLCAPRWDSPALFGELVGGHGVYAVTPATRGTSGAATTRAAA